MGRKLKHPIGAADVARALGLELLHGDASIDSVATAGDAGAGALAFAKDAIWAARAHASCVLIADPACAAARTGPTLLSTEPRLAFAKVVAFLQAQCGFEWSEEEAKVHPSARIGRHVVLGRGVSIGEGTVIHHNVVIGDEVQIGKRCTIKSCAVIGEDGFGFEREPDGTAVRLPHIGGVVIGDDVEIGSLATVCRGTLGNTIVHDGAKIDDHVHLAHNVQVGAHAFVIGGASISGGVKLGARSWVAPNASILNQVSVGNDAVVGLGAVVVKAVPDNTAVMGYPAKQLPK